jgi:predicted transcriptional regulator
MLSTFRVLVRLPLDAFKYRDRYTITADILKAITRSKRGARKTHIMQRANLNTISLNKYLDLLLRNGYVISEGRLYKLTGRGMEFLENIDTEAMKMQWRL